MEKAGLANLRSEYHDLEMELEQILQSSLPNSQDTDKIKQMFKEDLTENNLGMKSYLKNNKIFFYFPISMIVGDKQ
jgi:hypothetical protein